MKTFAHCLLTIAVVIGLLHWLLTGVPVPLWHCDILTNKQPTFVTGNVITVGDVTCWSEIVQSYPETPLFAEILSRGTSIENGVWTGTIRLTRPLPDPYVFDQRIANMLAVALSLHPEGLSSNAPTAIKKALISCKERIESRADKNRTHLDLGNLVTIGIIEDALRQEGWDRIIIEESTGAEETAIP